MFSDLYFLLLQLATSALPEHKLPNIFHPQSAPARSEFGIAVLVFAITGTIFVVVASLLVSG